MHGQVPVNPTEYGFQQARHDHERGNVKGITVTGGSLVLHHDGRQQPRAAVQCLHPAAPGGA